MPETSDGFPLFSCCHSEPTSLVSESVEDAMVPVAFNDEEEAESCADDKDPPLPQGSLHSAKACMEFNYGTSGLVWGDKDYIICNAYT